MTEKPLQLYSTKPLQLYSTKDHDKCRVCGQPGSPATPLIQTHNGWKCGASSSTCRPKRQTNPMKGSEA